MGTLSSSTTPYISVIEPNGSYPYSIVPVNNYNVTGEGPSPIVVHGGEVTVLVSFSVIMTVNYTTGSSSSVNEAICGSHSPTLSLLAEVRGGVGRSAGPPGISGTARPWATEPT